MTPKIAYLLLVIIVLGDILSSITYNLSWGFSNFGLLIKTPVEFFFLIYSLKFIKSNLVVTVIFIFFIIWIIGITTCSFNSKALLSSDVDTVFSENESIYVQSFKVLNRYIFFFQLSILMSLYADNEGFIVNVKRLFESFIIVNSLCIILGFFFKLNIFSSYNLTGKITDFEPRFGYKGVLFGVNEITGVTFLAISHYYREILLYKNKKKILILLLVIFAACLEGTKGSLIAVLMITCYYFYRYFTRFFFLVFLPAVSISVFVLVTRYLDAIMDILSTVSKSNSLLAVLSSGRSDYVIKNLAYIQKNWFFLNYIFGDGALYSETDLFDLYFFFGLGCLLYLFFYTKLFLKYERTRDRVPIYLLMLLLAFTNGHMIQSAVFPVFLILYLVSSKNTFSDNKNNEDSICFDSNR